MSFYTIEDDIEFLKDSLGIDEDCGEVDCPDCEFSRRVQALIQRLREVQEVMPLAFMYVPPEEIDRAVDRAQPS